MTTHGRRAGRREVWDHLAGGLAILVHSNVWISLAATGVAVTTIRLLDRPLDPLPLFVVFAATLFVYSFNRIADLTEDARNVPDRAAFTRRYGRWLFVLGTLLYLAAGVLAVVRQLPMAEFLVLPAVVAVCYSSGGLKRLLLVKNLLVGLAWGAIPLGVGAYYGILWRVDLWLLAAVVVVLLTVAAAVFDIKDVPGDRAAGVRTLPVVYGPRSTRILAAVGTLAVAAGIGLGVIAGVVPRRYLLLLAWPVYVLAYVPLATRDRGPLFYGFVVDGEHVAVAALVVLSQGPS